MTEWEIERTVPIRIDRARSGHEGGHEAERAPDQWITPNPATPKGTDMVTVWGAFVGLGLLIVVAMLVLVVALS